jgi:hypothetical protein
MLNNIITYKELKCPTKELECILIDLFKKYSITGVDLDKQILSKTAPTTINISGGNSLDILPLIQAGETKTTLQDLVLTGSILSLTYKGEDGFIQTVSEDLSSLISTSVETVFAGTSVDGSISITSAGTNGHTPDFKVNFPAPIPDVTTTLINNNDGTATYTNELGIPVTFPIGSTTVVDNGDGTYTVTMANGSVVTISDTSVSTMVNNGNGTFTYTDEAGIATTFSAGTPETITAITNTIVGNKIGDYTNETGTVVPINETISTVTSSANGFSYTNESGVIVSTTFVINGTNLEISVGGTLVSTIPLTLNEIQINNAGSDFDLTDDIISFVETNGDTATINFSKYNISAVINPNGSTDIFQNGNLITTIQKPVVVNNVPLLSVINPLVVQTANLASIVTDSNGDKFYIDYLGNATKITTDFLLTVNAGTTAVATDDSLGTATIGNGGVIHFYSSDGSILFGVVQGSAETDITTQANIIPFASSVPVGNDAGLASITVQGAIDEVDSKVEALEDRNRAWAKTGDLQSTNSEDVLVSHNVFQIGKTNVGDTEALMPFKADFTTQVRGNERVYGFDTHTVGFQTDLNEKPYSNDGAYIIIDPINGVDGLELHTYYANFSRVPVNKFKTIKAAIAWTNKCNRTTVYIEIINTTLAAPLVNNSIVFLTGKAEVSIASGTGSKQFIRLDTDFSFYNSIVHSLRIEWLVNATDALRVNNNSQLYLLNSNITALGAITSIVSLLEGLVNFDSGVNIVTFSANNQSLFHCTGNDGGKVIFSNHTGLGESFVVGAFTGLRWGSSSPSRSLETWFVSQPVTAIPSVINMSDTVIYYGTSQALRQTVYDNLSFNYAQNLGTIAGSQTPLRFLDMTSATPDGTFVTKKKLVVNQLGEVIVATDTAGGTDLGIEEDQIATASQTVFTLPVAPIGRMVSYWGGVKLPKGSVTYSGVTATYNPALNGGQNFLAGDVISFVY